MDNKKIIKSELYEQNISGDKFLKFIRDATSCIKVDIS